MVVPVSRETVVPCVRSTNSVPAIEEDSLRTTPRHGKIPGNHRCPPHHLHGAPSWISIFHVSRETSHPGPVSSSSHAVALTRVHCCSRRQPQFQYREKRPIRHGSLIAHPRTVSRETVRRYSTPSSSTRTPPRTAQEWNCPWGHITTRGWDNVARSSRS